MKLYKKLSALLLFSLLLPFSAIATHIVGGSLTYAYGGANTYTITLKLYRDCDAGSADFSPTALVHVQRANGSEFSPSLDITLPTISTSTVLAVPPPCSTPPATPPCVAERIYRLVVVLLPSPGGLHLYHQVCCRNGSITNIVGPSSKGESFYAFIPCYNSVWTENMTLANGTTSDAGATAWTRTMGTVPVTSASIQSNQFEITGANGVNSWLEDFTGLANGTTVDVGATAWTRTMGPVATTSASVQTNQFEVTGANAANFWSEDFALPAGTTVDAGPTAWTRTVSVGSTAQVNGAGTLFEITGANNGTMTWTSQIIPIGAYTAGINLSIDLSEASTLEGGDNITATYSIDGGAPVTLTNGSQSNDFGSITATATGLVGTNIQLFVSVQYDGASAGEIYRIDNVILSGNASVTWTSQLISIAAITQGANLRIDLSEAGTLDAGDNILVTYSVDGGAPVTFPINGSIANDFTNAVAEASGLVGTNVQIFIKVNYDIVSAAAQIYRFDNVLVYSPASVTWTSQVIGIGAYASGVNLSANLSTAGGIDLNDNITVSYSLNGGAPVLFPTAGSVSGAITDTIALASGLVGATIQIFVTARYDLTSPATEIYRLDMVTVYDNTFVTNSNPVYDLTPPLYFCQTYLDSIDYSATDADGDVLVYSLFTPYENAPNPPWPTTPDPTFSDNTCSFTTITWTAGYSATSPFNSGGPSASINAATGFLSGVANTIGNFVFGVKCQEYRGAVLLGETTRGYQVQTIVCAPFVPPAPTAGTSSPAPICTGQTLSLTASTVVGATGYTWNGPNGFTSSLQDPTIAGVTTAASGTYSVAATVAGCTGLTGTVSITVNPTPATPIAGSNSTVCSGQTLSLTSNTVGGSTYNWSGPNSFTSTAEDPTIAAVTTAAAGTYTVSRTSAIGCISTATTTIVAITQTPSAPSAGSNTPVCVGLTVSLTASTIAGATYSWTGPNSFTSTLEDPTIGGVTTAASGTYSVTASVSGCVGPAGTTSVTITNIPVAPGAGNNGPVCEGQTVSLTTSTVASATYNWSGPNSFTSSIEDPTIPAATTAATGNYTITVTVGGCTGPASTTSVTVNPIPPNPTPSSTSPVCSGQTLSLAASSIPSATYSWNGPNSFTSATQNPTIAGITTAGNGTYSVTATVSGCISPVGTTSVVVNQTPSAPVAGSNSPVCTGQTLSLTASTIPGATYSWNGPNSFSSVSQNPNIAGVTTAYSGTYSVTATIGGCVGPTATLSVTINQTPAILTPGSNTPLCVGQTLSLTSNTIAGTYAWNGPNGFGSALEDPTIAAIGTVNAGTYSVTITVAGCVSPVATTAVTVNTIPAAPTAGSNSPICAGQTLSLTANTIGGATYAWTGPNAFASALEDPTIAAATTAASGTYSVTVTVLGCTGPVGTTTVTVNPIPAAPTAGSNSPVCSGQTLSLTSNTVAGSTYNWTGPNSFTATAEDPTIAGVTTAAGGTYTVTRTSAAGCVSTAATTSVVINPTPVALTPGSNSPVCVGQTLSLTANTVAGTYAWNGPNGFGSALEDPTIAAIGTVNAGTYSVTITVAGCVSPVATTVVTVNTIPAAPTAGSNSPICAGQTLSLTANTIGGATYAWTGPNAFASALEDPTIAAATTAASGTYSVTVTVSGCTGPVGTTAVTVNPIPAALTAGSNAPVCVGQTLSLTANTIAGTYAWSGPNGFASALEDPTIAGVGTVNAGTYSVTITVAGCTSPVATTVVVVNTIPAAPTAGNNSPVCVGQTLSLTANTIGGATYSWSGPNSFTSAAEDPTIAGATVAASGTYSVTVTVAGCTGAAGVTTATVSPSPAAPTAGSNSPMCTGSTLSLTSNTIGGATYSWSGPNSFTSSMEDPTIAGVGTIHAGTYSVAVTVAGCMGPAGTTSVVISPPPAPPAAGNSGPVCTGYTLSLTASTIASATYNWSGPNGFTSSLEDPLIPAVTTAAAGTYSVSVTVGGCTGAANTTSATINVAPASPAPSSNAPICNGQNLSLTASSTGVSYNWNGPNAFTSTVQNPSIAGATSAATGTYSVTATGANGCVSTPPNTLSVTVTQTPTAPVAGNDSPLCSGQTVSLTASTFAGATYSWSGPNSFTSTLQNPTIPGLTTAHEGTYSVTATVAGCTGPVGTTTVVVDNTPPNPVAGSNAPLCTGATMSLTASNISMATYDWAGPNGFTSTLQNPTIPGISTVNGGSYSVTATVGGCTGAPGTTSVTVSVNPAPPNPVVSTNSPICAGQDLSLTSSTIASASYSWTGPNGFSSSLEDPVISGASTAASGTYSVVASYTTSCASSVITTAPVTVNPVPAAPVAGSNGPLCTGVTLSLTASTIGGATYSWSGPNSFTSTVQNPTVAGVGTADAGTYSVTATVTGCTGPAGTVSVSITPPETPTMGSNSPVCTGQTLSLTANTVASATYSWTGPNGFTSSLEDPAIAGISTAAGGTYSVTITLTGCTGPVGTTPVTVNSRPATPAPSSNSPLCVGATLTLTSTTIAGTTYSWSGPNSFTSTMEDPSPIAGIGTADAGTYSVTVTSIATGCVSDPGIVSVTVNTIPASPVAGSNSTICSGQTLSLSATPTGSTYSWTGPNSFTSTNQNPTIAGASTAYTGTYSVTATTLGCTSPVGTTSVTIYQTPALPVTGSNSPVCVGQDLSLTASSVGATYSWSGPASFTSTAQNPVITPATTAEAGTYSVTPTSSQGCPGPTGTVAVVITPLPAAPTAGSNSTVCSGNTLSLSASTIAAATYAWTGPNSFTSTLQNPTIAGVTTAASGSYSVIATVSGCAGPAGTVSVTINQTPVAPTAGSNSPVCAGQDLSLTASTIGGASYSWTGPNSFTSTSEDPVITSISTLGSGTYSVTATVLGCTGPAGATVVTVNAVPVAPTAGSNSPVCTGQNLNLTSNTVGSATYSWTGPNGFTSSLEDPMIAGVTTAEAGTYSVNVTVIGCTSPDGTTVVVINETPAMVVAGSNSPICSGQTLSLTANTLAGATYAWTGPNSFTSTLEDPTIVSATTAASGTYSVTATVTGCTSAAGATAVTVNPTPSLVAGSNTPVCVGNTLSLTAPTVAGGTYSWSGPNSFTSTLEDPTIAGVATTETGTYTVTVISAAGCASPPAFASVTITPSILVAAGSDQTVCANNSNVALSGSVTGGTTTGIWTSSGTGGFIPGAAFVITNYLPSPADTAIGTVTLTITSTNNGGCAPVSASMVVTITDAPTSNAGSDQTVCANNSLVTLTGSISGTATGGLWASSGTGVFGSTTSLSTTYTPSNADTAAGSVILSLTTTGIALCSPWTDTMIVTITNAPRVNAGADISVCINNANALLSGTSTTGNGVWTTMGTGTFTPTATTLGATYVPGTADTTAGSVILILTSTVNGLCNPEDDSVTVFYTPQPTVAAGSDVTVCANNATVTLTGASSTGTAIWSTAGTGTFTPSATTLAASYIPSAADTAAGSVTLTLTTTNNGGCIPVVDNMTVTITDAPRANAGADQTVCANNPAVTLSGSFSTATGGLWSSSGTGAFTPSNTNMGATYTPSSADTAIGTVTVTLTTTGNGLCNPVTDIMVITITNVPSVNAGINTVACKNNPNVPLAGTSSTGSAVWTTTGTGTFTPTATTLTATYNSSPADTTAGSVILILTSTGNGNCLAEDDSITITYIDKPIVNAGPNLTVCTNNPNFAITGTSNTGSGIWTTAGTGTFVPSAVLLSTNYSPSPADLLAGTITLYLTSTNNGTCLSVQDTMVVTISPAPTSNAGVNQTVCANNAVVTLSGGFTVSTGAGWTSLGSGIFAPDTFSMGATYTPSAADTAAGSVTLVLTTTGNGNCNPVTDTMIITITDAPRVNAGPDQLVCLSSPVATLTGTSTTGSGTWTTAGTGTFTSTTSLATTYSASAADTTAGSVTLVLTSTANGLCNAVTDTILLTFVPAPVVTAGADQTVCANADTVSLTGTSTTGSGIWTTNGTGSFVPTSAALTTTYVPSFTDTANGTITLTFTSTAGCVPVSDNMTVTITPAPKVNAGVSQIICAGTDTAFLTGSVTSGASTGIWSTGGTGTFTPGNTVMNPAYLVSVADSTAGGVIIYLTSTGNGLCNAVIDSMVIAIVQPASVNAGPDQTLCALPLVNLNGVVTGGSGTGGWTTIGGGGSFIPDTSALNGSYSPSTSDTTFGGTVIIVLHSTNNGNCPPSTDTMVVTFFPPPVAFAGADIVVCRNNADSIPLSGIIQNAGGNLWTSPSTGTFTASDTLINPFYHPDSLDFTQDTIVLTITTTGTGSCPSAKDSVYIIFSPAPLVNAGADVLVCEGDSLAVLNGSVTGGATSGQWSSLGSGYFVPNDSALNATYVLGPADTAAGGTTLILTSTNNSGCNPETDTVEVIITLQPLVAAGNDVTVCANNAAVALTGTVTVGSTTGIWTSGGTGTFTPADTILNATYTPSAADTAAGTVTIYLTSTNGCIPVVDSLVITLTNAPVVNAGADVSICEGSSVALNGTVMTATGAQWTSSGTGTFTPNDSTLNATYVPGSGDTTIVTITLTSTGNGLCLAVEDSLTITIGRAPLAGFSYSQICTGQAMTFTDTSSVLGTDTIVSWNWIFDSGTDTVQNPSHTYSVAGTDTVLLIVTTALGCTDTAMHIVNINPTPVPSFTFTTSCSVDSVYFTSTSTIPSGAITSWTWNFGDGTPTSSLQNPAHYYDSTGVYIVSLSVTSDSGCTAVFTDSVMPAKGLFAGFSNIPDCQYNVVFTDTTFLVPGDSILTWQWNFGDGSPLVSIQNPSHAYVGTGTYVITLVVTSVNGCVDTISDTIFLAPLAIADFTPQSGTYNVGTTIAFTDLSTNPTSWFWYFGDGNTDTVQNPSHQYTSNGTLDVTLIVMNSQGCPDTATYTLIFNTNIVAVPSAFTPNGDLINDILMVLGGPLKEMDFRIYNEWGNELFRSTDQNIGWTGYYKNKLQPAARYVYVLTGVTFGDAEINMKGDVTIIR